MQKIPNHLRIVSDKKNKDFKTEENSPVKKEEVVYHFDQNFLDKLMYRFDLALEDTLRKDTVRNMDDLDRLYDKVIAFTDQYIHPLYSRPERHLDLWIALINMAIRLSKIDYKIKKPPLEVNFSLILFVDLFKYPFLPGEFRQNSEEIVSYFYDHQDFMEIRSDWLVVFWDALELLEPDINNEKIVEMRKAMLKKFFKEKFRIDTLETVDTLSNTVWNFIQSSINQGMTEKQIENFFGNNRLEYGVNAHYINFLNMEQSTKETYKLIQTISKKGKLKKFYERISKRENEVFKRAIFQYLYLCICLNQFDYFENIFPIFTRLTLDPKQYADLLKLYSAYATEKRIRRFLHKCISRDSMLSEEAQKSLRKAILKK